MDCIFILSVINKIVVKAKGCNISLIMKPNDAVDLHILVFHETNTHASSLY